MVDRVLIGIVIGLAAGVAGLVIAERLFRRWSERERVDRG